MWREKNFNWTDRKQLSARRCAVNTCLLHSFTHMSGACVRFLNIDYLIAEICLAKTGSAGLVLPPLHCAKCWNLAYENVTFWKLHAVLLLIKATWIAKNWSCCRPHSVLAAPCWHQQLRHSTVYVFTIASPVGDTRAYNTCTCMWKWYYGFHMSNPCECMAVNGQALHLHAVRIKPYLLLQVTWESVSVFQVTWKTVSVLRVTRAVSESAVRLKVLTIKSSTL